MSPPLEWLARLWWGPPLWELAALDSLPEAEADSTGSIDATESDWLALVTAADLFVRAGGIPSPGWWGRLSPLERLALVEAGDRVWSSRAVAIGLATLPGGPETVSARYDGGRAHVRLLVQREAAAGAAEFRGQEVGR